MSEIEVEDYICSLLLINYYFSGAAGLLERKDCGKANEFMGSLELDSLPQLKSCIDTFLAPPLSLNTLFQNFI